MLNLSLLLICRKCKEEFLTGESSTNNIILKIDFEKGIISYICPFCGDLNILNINDKKIGKTLPNPKGF